MKKRVFGYTGFHVSEVGLGAWQLGADWGEVSEEDALRILNAAIGSGINFIDTADVYGMGRSESLIGRFLKERSEEIFIATKMGRFPEPGWPHNFSLENFRKFAQSSLSRLGVEALDLTQLHCIPSEVLKQGEVFDWLRTLRAEGLIKHFGVSVESMDEALFCVEQEGVVALQIIFNLFRQKPIHTLFDKAKERDIALIVRLPLASGLLSGRYTKETAFPANDHRNYNRDGEFFNVGETFAGLPFEKGVEISQGLQSYVPQGMSMAQMAMRWILDYDAVSVVIPGARTPEQAKGNAAASDLPPLSPALHKQLEEYYRNEVEPFIRGPY